VAGYRFAVAPGTYDVELRFAELSGFRPGDRVFGVRVGAAVVVEALDLAREVGTHAARIVRARVSGARPLLEVAFQARTGEPLVNGILIRRLT
jgi:hypothetical protein